MQLFLSYNSADRTSVIAVQKLLQARDITTFLDRDNLVPGLAWPQALEQALRAVDGVAVFIGCELGGWQKREMWFALDRQVREEKEGRAFPVIPVLLQGADLTPGFLFSNTWIDLRRELDGVFTAEALNAFERAIKATEPVRDCEDSAARVAERAAICPYRGLQVFREEDAAFFVGRKALAEQLLDFTLGKNLVAVVGPSGSGKSSVVQAGLLPLLRRQQPPANTWDAVSFTPGHDPFHRLASALIPLLEPNMSETARLAEAEKLGRDLAADRTRVEAVINRVIEKSNGTGRLLLVADQFEELFTLTPEPDRRPFARALLHARGSAPVTALVTLRADFYSQIITLDRELSDVLTPAQVNIGALTPDELRESITAPARLVGLEFEPGLVDRILTDVGSEPGRLPLVQFALTEIWQRRKGGLLTNRAYDEIGGVTGALARRTEAEFARLNPEEQTGAKRLFSRLVRVARSEEAGEDTRQRTELSEADTLAKRVAKHLADARLLVTGSEAGMGTIWVEVAHEALIRNWERLRGWLNDDREFLLWRERLGALLTEWGRAEESNETLLRGPLLIEAQKWFDQRSQDLSDQERKFISASQALRERQRRRRAFAVAGSMTVVSTLLVLLFFMWRGANDQRLAAQEQAHLAQIAAEAAQHALTDSFFHTIGVLNQDVLPRDEREALWELAQLDRANTAVRDNLLKGWFRTAEAFMRGEARGGQGFQAATGLNLEYHRLVISCAPELGQRIAAVLENADFYNLSSLANPLAALAAKMEPQAAAEIAKQGALRIAAALEKTQLTHSYNLSSLSCSDLATLSSAVAALTAKMEPQAAAEIAKQVAQRIAAALEKMQITDSYNLPSLGNALTALAAKMEPQAAAEIAKQVAQRIAAALENADSYNLSSLASALAALAAKMEPQAAAEIARRGAQRLAAVLENPQETDSYNLSSLGNALAALAAKMDPRAAAEIERQVALRIAAALEKTQVTDSYNLSSLGNALAALAAKIEPRAAAEIAKGLAEALDNPQETDSNRLWSLGRTLAAFCPLLPSAHHTQKLALSNLLLAPVPKMEDEDKEQSNDRKLLVAVCAQLRPQDLAEVLKYPSCTGEAGEIVLKELQAQTGRDFAGNVWKFVVQADTLRVKDVSTPAKRPSVRDALKELDSL